MSFKECAIIQSKEAKHRIFLGIPLSLEQGAELLAVTAQRWPELAEDFRWTKSSNCHVTLQFLGDLRSTAVAELIQAIQTQLLPRSSFVIPITKIDIFPPGRDRMIAAYLTLTEPLALLYHHLNQIINGLGYEVEKRDYLPHITLGRKKSHHFRPIKSILLENHNLLAQEFIVYESKPEEEGSYYFPLFRYVFKNPSP